MKVNYSDDLNLCQNCCESLRYRVRYRANRTPTFDHILRNLNPFTLFTSCISEFPFNSRLVPNGGRESSVSRPTCYGLDGLGIESRWGARFSAPVQIGPGVHPASYTMGTGSFPGVKRPGRGVDHPPQLASRLKEE
jgi:hypothetical protein